MNSFTFLCIFDLVVVEYHLLGYIREKENFCVLPLQCFYLTRRSKNATFNVEEKEGE